VQFSKTGIEYPLVGRAASFGFYLLDSGDSLRFSADFVAQLYHPQGVREMLEDVNRVALAIAKNPNANVNDIAKFASYYGIAEKPPRPDMSEYIVSGANSLPALKLSTIET
jgi:hypothetical protein